MFPGHHNYSKTTLLQNLKFHLHNPKTKIYPVPLQIRTMNLSVYTELYFKVYTCERYLLYA